MAKEFTTKLSDYYDKDVKEKYFDNHELTCLRQFYNPRIFNMTKILPDGSYNKEDTCQVKNFIQFIDKVEYNLPDYSFGACTINANGDYVPFMQLNNPMYHIYADLEHKGSSLSSQALANLDDYDMHRYYNSHIQDITDLIHSRVMNMVNRYIMFLNEGILATVSLAMTNASELLPPLEEDEDTVTNISGINFSVSTFCEIRDFLVEKFSAIAIELFDDFSKKRPVQYSNLIDNRFETETVASMVMNIYTSLESEVTNTLINNCNDLYVTKYSNTIYNIIMDNIGSWLLLTKSNIMQLYYVLKAEIYYVFVDYTISNADSCPVAELVNFRNDHDFEELREALKSGQFNCINNKEKIEKCI